MKTCKSLWNWQRILGSLLAAGLLAPCGVCRGETVYDAAADLTKDSIAAKANPNGPWAYGYRATAVSSDFTPFPTAGVSPPWRAVTEDVQGWWLEPSRGFDMTPPYVLANVGTKTVASTFHPYSTATLRPGNLYVHPAAGDRAYVVVRWTAPASGSYLVDTVFTGMDSRGATTDPHVVLNGRDLFAGYIRGGLDTPTNVASYKKTISVAKGDTIDFAVGPGGNGYICDSTGLMAKIALVAPASGGTVYDAAADLTKESVAAKANPNGAWSYGYRGSAASSEFTLLPSSGVEEIWHTVGGDVEGWWLEPARGFDHSPPWLMKNMGAATVSSTFHPFSTATLRPGNLLVHPAAGDRAYVVVRWTAPASGSYLIDTVFTGMDSRGATTDPHVVLNGRELFAGDIRGGLDTPTNVASYKKTISIAKGDTIDFAVGPGGNGYICDSTGLTAKIALVDGAFAQCRPAIVPYHGRGTGGDEAARLAARHGAGPGGRLPGLENRGSQGHRRRLDRIAVRLSRRAGRGPRGGRHQADAQRRHRRLAAGDQDRRRRSGRTPRHRLLFRGENARQRYGDARHRRHSVRLSLPG